MFLMLERSKHFPKKMNHIKGKNAFSTSDVPLHFRQSTSS